MFKIFFKCLVIAIVFSSSHQMHAASIQTGVDLSDIDGNLSPDLRKIARTTQIGLVFQGKSGQLVEENGDTPFRDDEVGGGLLVLSDSPHILNLYGETGLRLLKDCIRALNLPGGADFTVDDLLRAGAPASVIREVYQLICADILQQQQAQAGAALPSPPALDTDSDAAGPAGE